MCVVSMVYDHFNPVIPQPKDWTVTKTTYDPNLAFQVAELAKLIKEFREAVEAAKKVDELTKQPDCADPEKAKLEARVAELEKIIKKLERRSKGAKKRG